MGTVGESAAKLLEPSAGIEAVAFEQCLQAVERRPEVSRHGRPGCREVERGSVSITARVWQGRDGQRGLVQGSLQQGQRSRDVCFRVPAQQRLQLECAGVNRSQAEVASHADQGVPQLDSSTTRTHGGSGLGLAICQHLARLMGGTLELRSELGQGSVFTFHVDLDLQPDPPGPPVSCRTPGSGRVSDHVTKPIHAPSLIATVRQHVARAGHPSASPPPVHESSPSPKLLARRGPRRRARPLRWEPAHLPRPARRIPEPLWPLCQRAA